MQDHRSALFESLFIEVIALAGRLKRPMLLPQAAELAVGARRVLQVLSHEGPLTVPQIGRLLGTSRQNIQVIVNRLKPEGFVDVILNPAHERSVLVQATQSGKSLVTPSIEEETRIFGELTARFSTSHLNAAADLLHEIRLRLDARSRQSGADAIATGGRMPEVKKNPPLGRPKFPPLAKTVASVQISEPEDYELPVNLL